MSCVNSNNNGPNRGRGRGRGKKRNTSRGSGRGVNRSAWSYLEPAYQSWLTLSGIARDATSFHNLTIEQRISASSAFNQSVKTTELEELTTLLRHTLISQANPYAVISDSHCSKDDSAEVKTASMAFYGLPDEHFCQVLGQQPEQIKIVNAHIWPRSGTTTLPLFGLKTGDIDNPRNVLRLHQCIERAFDSRELVFVADNANENQLVVKVLSTDLKPTLLKGTQKRFADIDGAPLQIKSSASPYIRLLAHHSVLAHRWAREKGWISDDLAAEEVKAGALMEHSLDPEAQRRIKLLWQKRDLP